MNRFPSRTHWRLRAPACAARAWPLLLAALGALLPGCAGGGRAVVPAGPSAENWQTDTLRLPVPPTLEAPGAGRPALPARVERHAPIPAPAPFRVSEIQLDADTLTVRSPRATRRFAAPAAGETLRVRREKPAHEARAAGASKAPGDTLPRVTGRVEGRPQPDTIPAPPEEEEEAGVFEKLAGLPAWGLAGLLALAAGVLIFFFRMFR